MSPELHQLHLEAGKKCGVEHTCGNKIKFSHEELAEKHAKAHNKWEERRHDVEAYPCGFCNHWHVGRIISQVELEKIISST